MIEINKYNYDIENKESVCIKLIGDMHYSKNFNKHNLGAIEEYLINDKTDYLFIAGDLIDSTDELDDKVKYELIKFLTNLAKHFEIFITLGNHDQTSFINRKAYSNIDTNFWSVLSKIDKVHISHYEKYYIDDKIEVYMLEMPFDYYNSVNKEHLKQLEDKIKKDSNLFSNSSNTIKIVLTHSPYYLSEECIVDKLKDFDYIFTGHMHSGLMPSFIGKIIKNNYGIISPNRSLFPNNARGVIPLLTNSNKKIYLHITSGITKLSPSVGCLKIFNNLYPSSIDKIDINCKVRKKKNERKI